MNLFLRVHSFNIPFLAELVQHFMEFGQVVSCKSKTKGKGKFVKASKKKGEDPEKEVSSKTKVKEKDRTVNISMSIEDAEKFAKVREHTINGIAVSQKNIIY